MKKLSKIVALLLAGAMAMVMLTACGGAASETPLEDNIRQKLGKNPNAVGLCDADGRVRNDKSSELYKTTQTNLNAKIGSSLTGTFVLDVDTDVGPDKEYATFTVYADYKTAGLVANLVNKITEKIGEIKDTNNSVKLEGNWAKVAVVVKTTDKGSYAAIAIKVKNIAYKGK